MTYALAIHGGAGARPEIDYSEQMADMMALVVTGQAMLKEGRDALDVVTAMVSAMEASGLYVAGKGSAPNSAGDVELDASIMEGATQRAGAVGAIRGVVSPIKAARSVMEDGRYVLLAGEGARSFAEERQLEFVEDPESYYGSHNRDAHQSLASRHGTVGAVALDLEGNLAAGTSTGGTFDKHPGRVGDTPLIGSGNWADDNVAVSCTGVGEFFIRANAAHDVAGRMRHGSVSLYDAANAALETVAKLGGDGGLIAVDQSGHIVMPYNSKGMKRAAVSDIMDPIVRVFEPE